MGEVERRREVPVSRRNIALCIESTGHSQRWPAFASDKLGTMLVLLVERADPAQTQLAGGADPLRVAMDGGRHDIDPEHDVAGQLLID